MFGTEQSSEWRDLVELDDGRVPFAVNCLLVRAAERRILIDTGCGRVDPVMRERYGTGVGKLVDSLAALGLRPADIDTVIINHAHGDHIGGATDEGGRPAFP